MYQFTDTLHLRSRCSWRVPIFHDYNDMNSRMPPNHPEVIRLNLFQFIIFKKKKQTLQVFLFQHRGEHYIFAQYQDSHFIVDLLVILFHLHQMKHDLLQLVGIILPKTRIFVFGDKNNPEETNISFHTVLCMNICVFIIAKWGYEEYQYLHRNMGVILIQN